MPRKTPPVDQTALNALQSGFYVLQGDVLNPRPDRRHKNDARGMEVIPKGTRFQAIRRQLNFQDADAHFVELRIYGQNQIIPGDHDCPLAALIAPLLQPAEPALGHVIGSIWGADPKELLAALLDRGLATVADLEWAKKHWIDKQAY